MLRWIQRKGGPRYSDIEKVYNTSVAAYKAGERPRGSRLNMRVGHAGAYPVKLPKPRCTNARHQWENYWYSAWPCHTYIEKLPARCGVSEIDDQYVTNNDVPEDRFEIYYAPSHRPWSGMPPPLMVWRPDGSCVISTRIFSYGENGCRERVYGFTPIKYVWVRYGSGYFTMGDYWRRVQCGNESWQYTYMRDVENHYHVPRTGLVRVPTTWSDGVPDTAGDWVGGPNPGFIIPADRRKRPHSVLPFESSDGILMNGGSVTTRLQTSADIARCGRKRTVATRAVRSVIHEIDRNLDHWLEPRGGMVLKLVSEHEQLRNYISARTRRVRTNRGVVIKHNSVRREQLDYNKDRGRAVHFENA